MKEFLKLAFSDDGQPSSSRLISGVCAVAVIIWISHVVWHNHQLPDAIPVGAVTAFSTSHYLTNRAFSNK